MITGSACLDMYDDDFIILNRDKDTDNDYVKSHVSLGRFYADMPFVELIMTIRSAFLISEFRLALVSV